MGRRDDAVAPQLRPATICGEQQDGPAAISAADRFSMGAVIGWDGRGNTRYGDRGSSCPVAVSHVGPPAAMAGVAAKALDPQELKVWFVWAPGLSRVEHKKSCKQSPKCGQEVPGISGGSRSRCEVRVVTSIAVTGSASDAKEPKGAPSRSDGSVRGRQLRCRRITACRWRRCSSEPELRMGESGRVPRAEWLAPRTRPRCGWES